MFDDERLVLDPREGERVSGSSGERAVVGVAAIALLGGILIFAANLVASLGADEAGRDGATATASTRPSPTARPSPTPRPLRDVTIAPGTPPPPRVLPDESYGFFEARADIVLRGGPQAGALAVGALAAGDLAFATGPVSDGDWYHVGTPDGGGWMQASDGTTTYAEKITSDYPVGPEVWSVTAGAEGYIAMGSQPTPDDPIGQLVLHSPDGITWTETVPAARGAWVTLVAWGPAGWLAVTEHEAPSGGGTTWLSRLADGRWETLGSFSAIDSIHPTQLIGSDVGYLLTTQGRGGYAFEQVGVWASTDGQTWRESEPLEIGAQGWLNVAAVPGGFYAWGGPGIPTKGGAFSANGRAWTQVAGGPLHDAMRLVGLDDRVVAIEIDPTTRETRTWMASVAGGVFTWHESVEEPAFAGAGVSALAGADRRAVAFGWDVATDSPRAWSQDEGWAPWERLELPDDFGGIPRVAAVGAEGAVVVGYRPTIRSSNPIFWHETERSSFAPEPRPIFDPVPDPTPEDCSALPVNPLGFLFVDRSLAVACRGADPLTFHAWAEACVDCAPMTDSGPVSWLIDAGGQISLSLAPGVGWGQSAVADPALVSELGVEPASTSGWVAVTGHFDDPRALDCQSFPSHPSEYLYYMGRAEAVRACRQQFVVTDLQPVAEP